MVSFTHPGDWPAIEHEGVPPGWTCAACSKPWPCVPAKEELTAEFRGFPTSLTVYMASMMAAAARDFLAHGGMPPPDLWSRFLGWVHPVPQGRAGGD